MAKGKIRKEPVFVLELSLTEMNALYGCLDDARYTNEDGYKNELSHLFDVVSDLLEEA